MTTFDHLQRRQDELRSFLSASGVDGPVETRPTVFLIGAGTSDYMGRSLQHLLRTKWQCEVIPVASTSLPADFPEYALRDKRNLRVSLSRSGDSPEEVAVLERALAEYPRIPYLIVTCNASGHMSKAVGGYGDCLRLVLDVIFGQLLGLFASIRLGLKPDFLYFLKGRPSKLL
jgi:tagatose-6-phosphate ketose/aldose isomerase